MILLFILLLGSKCTPWEHPLYEDKDHGEFIPEAKVYNDHIV